MTIFAGRDKPGTVGREAKRACTAGCIQVETLTALPFEKCPFPMAPVVLPLARNGGGQQALGGIESIFVNPRGCRSDARHISCVFFALLGQSCLALLLLGFVLRCDRQKPLLPLVLLRLFRLRFCRAGE